MALYFTNSIISSCIQVVKICPITAYCLVHKELSKIINTSSEPNLSGLYKLILYEKWS